MQVEHRTYSGRPVNFPLILEHLTRLEGHPRVYASVAQHPNRLFINYYLPMGSDTEPLIKELRQQFKNTKDLVVQFTYAPKDYFPYEKNPIPAVPRPPERTERTPGVGKRRRSFLRGDFRRGPALQQ